MRAVLERHIDGITEDELEGLFRRDYLRRLTRYRTTDDFYKKKYNMDFENFERTNIVDTQNYSFEVESDAQEWELAIDGIRTVERKLIQRKFLGNICNRR